MTAPSRLRRGGRLPSGRRLLAGAALAAIGGSLAAAVASQPADAARDTIARAAALARREDCPGVLALLDPLVGRLPRDPDRTGAQLLRLPCLAAVGRGAEIAPVQAELAVAAPDDPLVLAFGVFVAMDARHYPEAADRMVALVRRRPAALDLLPSDLWRALAQTLAEAGDFQRRDDVAIALAEADWQPVDRPELRDWIAEQAAAALAARNDPAGARALLPRIAMPELLVQMAIDRGFAPLWPDIEARLGPHSEAAADRFAAAGIDAYAGDAGDPRARREAIRADIMLGRFADAVAAAAPIAVSAGMSEDDVQALRYAAQALDAAGDRAGAIARLQPFAALDLARSAAAAGAVVALADLLQEAGRPAETLAIARAAQAGGAAVLSAWGRADLTRIEACALGALGRAGEARAAADRLLARPRDNEPAAIEALLCGGRDEEAARLAIATLAGREGAGRIADRFQPPDADWAPSPSHARSLWLALLGRRDVRAAFDRAARILPPALRPRPGERPLPEAGSGPDATTI